MAKFFAALLNQIVGVLLPLTGGLFGLGQSSPVARLTQRKSFSANVLRADDLLALKLDFYNLRLDSAGRLILDSAGDSFVVVHFPSQSIAEQAFAEDNSSDPLQGPPVSARLSGESRVVFALDPGLLPLDFELTKILAALSQSAPLVYDRIGQPPATPPDGGLADFGWLRLWFGSQPPPLSQFTAIEAPWRLVLSPHPDGRWAHSPKPVSDGLKAELWHTRLGVRPTAGAGVDERSAVNRTARAVFSPDLSNDPPAAEPFRGSLRRPDRNLIVRSTADRSLPGNAPVAVDRLMLSSLGSWLQVHGAWNTNLDLIEWRHLSTLGRDQFVRVVKKGFLFPLGNRAVSITITERKIDMGRRGATEGKPVAYLRQRTFIALREPVKQFAHRAFPFRTVTFKTLITPNLIDPPDEKFNLAPGTEKTFWPRFEVAGVGRDVQFHIEGADWDGSIIGFAAPLIFVPASSDAGADIGKLVDAYNGQAGGLPAVQEANVRRNIPIGGQKVAFAPSQKPGDTALETDSLILGALNATGSSHFLPAMSGARVNNQALRQISRNARPSLIRFEKSFLDAPSSTFGNAGEIFARIDAPAGVTFPVEKTGGLVAPDFTPQGISRSFGAAGDVAAFTSGSFNPGAIFAGIKILGGVPLDKIFKLVPFGFPGQAGDRVPGLTSVRTTVDIGGVSTDVIETRYVWNVGEQQLQQQPIFVPLANAKFSLESVIDTPLDGKPPQFRVSGGLERFKIVLPPGNDALIGAQFDHIRFAAGTGQKLDVSVQFDEIVFEGPLSFVNEIRKYIPLDGFVDPPYLDVNASGVSAGFTLGIPTIGIGIFSLQNISLGAGFNLPFVGGAAGLRFAFCERDHPFLLTVTLFGGGGFFAIDLDTEKVTSVEASLEFGAAIAINLGVAAGQASITGGVYYQKSGAGFNITAFFRAAGSLSVLGLITVSVELYVGLGFESDKAKPHGGHLYGTASLTVKIKIVFFSTSVAVSIEREFAGSDPTFIQTVSADDWAEYCDAFALEAA